MKLLLVIYDNESHVSNFPLGSAYIAAVARNAGVDVTIYNQDVHHYPEEHLTEYLNNNRFDVVGLGFIGGYWQYRKALSISRAINASKKRPFFIIGGHGPSPEPGYFARKTGADVVVVGEGERTVEQILTDRFFCVKTGAKHCEPIRDVGSIPLPAWNLFPMEHYRLMQLPRSERTDFAFPVLSGRGCPFKCNFCYRMEPGVRLRSVESIVEEVSILKRDYGITYINFQDDLLMTSGKRAIEIATAMRPLKMKWMCNGRLNYARPDVLIPMAESGCQFINYGIESVDDAALERMGKCLTVKQIEEGIEATLAAGISPGFNIIWGNIGEDLATLEAGVQFLLRYDDGAQLRTIRPVTPYPGSPLYKHAIETGRLSGVEDFYERKHTNSDLMSVNFTGLTDAQFHDALMNANLMLIHNYYKRKRKQAEREAVEFYKKRNVDFRGFRPV